MTMNFAERIAALKTRAAAIRDAMQGLTDKRTSLALAAAEGDKAAEAEMARLDKDSEALTGQWLTLNRALDQLADQQDAADAEAEKTRRREIEAQARNVAAAILTTNEKIDAALFVLADLFQTRADLLNQLHSTKTVPANLIQRLIGKSCGTAAARAADLHKFLDLQHVGPSHIATLSEAGQGILSGPLVVQDKPRKTGEAA